MTMVEVAPVVATLSDLETVERVPFDDRDLPRSTYDLLVRTAERCPDGPAWRLLPDPSEVDAFVEITYATLKARVDQVARTLDALHPVGGRRVTALLAPSHLETPAVILGAQATGIFCAVNHLLEPAQIASILRAAGADVLVALGPSAGRDTWQKALAVQAALEDGPRLVQLRGDLDPDPAHLVLEDLLAGAAAGPPSRLPAPDDLASYFHTGGTTGAPKLAAHTHRNQVANAWMMNAMGDGRPTEGVAVLAGLPWFHVNAFMVTGLATFALGATAVVPGADGYRDPRFYPAAWRLVARHRIQAMSAVPTVYGGLVQVPVDADISCLQDPFVGAAPLSAALAQTWLTHTGVPLLEGYGCTEATCTITATPRSAAPRVGWQGLRLPYSELRIAAMGDEDDAPQPAGSVGRILVRGPQVFAGYVQDDGALHRPLRGGWYDTGDLGRLDQAGWLQLTGRAKDIIIRGGHNIDPALVVEALERHPEVALAAAVGRPDSHAGEVPVGFVQLVPGGTADANALLRWAQDTVPERAAVPKSVTVLPSLPVTAVGKVSSLPLRERAATDAVRALLTEASVEPVSVAAATDAGGRLNVTVVSGDPAATRSALAGLPVELSVILP